MPVLYRRRTQDSGHRTKHGLKIEAWFPLSPELWAEGGNRTKESVIGESGPCKGEEGIVTTFVIPNPNAIPKPGSNSCALALYWVSSQPI